MYYLSSNPPQKYHPSLRYIIHPEHQTSQVSLEKIETKLNLVISTENMHCSLFVKEISTNKVFSKEESLLPETACSSKPTILTQPHRQS
jgi:hypothetical protein